MICLPGGRRGICLNLSASVALTSLKRDTSVAEGTHAKSAVRCLGEAVLTSTGFLDVIMTTPRDMPVVRHLFRSLILS